MDKTKLPVGFYCYRENFMFGAWNGYRDKTDGHYLFGPIPGSNPRNYVTGKELFEWLAAFWQPPSREGQDYFCYKMPALADLKAPEGWEA